MPGAVAGATLMARELLGEESGEGGPGEDDSEDQPVTS
jgi:hypothetical protein